MIPDKPTTFCSIDVEDWYHIIGAGLPHQFHKPVPDTSTWNQFPPRVEQNTHWILDTLDEYGVQATFFTLGWVADHHPGLIREIAERGHEIASHGYWHRLINTQSLEEFREDIRRAKGALEVASGTQVHGYRASTASINDDAIEIVAEEGYSYDSSFYPVSHHDNYGTLSGMDASQPVERLASGLWEIKMSSLTLGDYTTAWSGGGYARLIPYPLFKWGIDRILAERKVYGFFFHPWEIDHDPPKLTMLRQPYHWRRYVGIEGMRHKLHRLLTDYQFEAMYPWLQRHVMGNDNGRAQA